MKELDDNVFIKSWYYRDSYLYRTFYVHYIDYSKRAITFTLESTEEEMMPQLLYFINKDLKEKGWETQHDDSPKEYNPADDPYYNNEDLYVP